LSCSFVRVEALLLKVTTCEVAWFIEAASGEVKSPCAWCAKANSPLPGVIPGEVMLVGAGGLPAGELGEPSPLPWELDEMELNSAKTK
jgi:hypothetical protein